MEEFVDINQRRREGTGEAQGRGMGVTHPAICEIIVSPPGPSGRASTRKATVRLLSNYQRRLLLPATRFNIDNRKHVPFILNHGGAYHRRTPRGGRETERERE